ncbi:hypothetical protein BDN70DRAFT_624340 [Pholiota conissans]|uniref:Uncharacterized protein n=1 Tax=Pholiota conissans TaxID=109636 RepID=A0A9P6D1H8_9AGAR|nr:hypothetical protein BDN70DRAFT_624340 [Pholiota conissans]
MSYSRACQSRHHFTFVFFFAFFSERDTNALGRGLFPQHHPNAFPLLPGPPIPYTTLPAAQIPVAALEGVTLSPPLHVLHTDATSFRRPSIPTSYHHLLYFTASISCTLCIPRHPAKHARYPR